MLQQSYKYMHPLMEEAIEDEHTLGLGLFIHTNWEWVDICLMSLRKTSTFNDSKKSSKRKKFKKKT